MNASEILTAAAATLEQRGKDYDQPEGERSMGRIVAAFNALTGHEMTEAEGWQFMAVLKLVRMGTASDPTDSAVDCAAYAALAGEALKPEPDEGGWIAWHGGECPVDRYVKVDVRLDDGDLATDLASDFNWSHEYGVLKIRAYRVVKE